MSTPPKKVPTIRLLLIGVALSAVNAVSFFQPERIPSDLVPMINLILAMLLAMEVLWLARTPKATDAIETEPALTPKTSREERTRHELAHFLGLLQEKGRLVDFLMEDIQSQPDARVGQVARVVHQGCKSVLDQHFKLEPLRIEPEGAKLTLEEDAPLDSLRLVGTVPADGPIQGSLVHKGWKTTSVTLPELTRILPESTDCYVVAPAELDVS
jgi:hypothetical protein